MPASSENEQGRPAPGYIETVPQVIPRSAHQVSRKNIDREALKVLYRLRDAGFIAYLVGGGVRDLYLGKTPKDFDISTDAKPGQIHKLFKNSRLIGRRFRLVQVFFRGGKIIEVSTFRCRSEFDITASQGQAEEIQVLAANNTYGTPEDDAFRRDLTINALFYEINTFSIIDYTGGVKDLDQGIIRMIGDPDRRIRRDPARMMRVIRHAARNNFIIEETTWQATKRHRQELKLCPVSRIRDELMKDLHSGASRAWAELAISSGLFEVLFPFYTSVLNQPVAGPDSREELLNILSVVDRLQNQYPESSLPEHLLWTMFLMPWAVAELGIMQSTHKRAEIYRFAKNIRDRLEENLEHLSIRRSIKETVTLLLANINLFRRYDHQPPKWLKKKSYYADCKKIYAIYREIHNGGQIDPAIVVDLGKTPALPAERTGSARSSRPRSRPAFAQKNRAGIFGFKASKKRQE
jgi:poly(A) polymerase